MKCLSFGQNMETNKKVSKLATPWGTFKQLDAIQSHVYMQVMKKKGTKS